MKIQVTACDVDREVPATTYEIRTSDGRHVEADLCKVHAEPIEALLRELSAEASEATEGDSAAREVVPTQEEPPQVSKRIANKAAPRQPATKRTTGRRRPRVVSLEEIEAQKKQR
ncbi:hypothetical protein [Streptomyces sp. NPDC001275]